MADYEWAILVPQVKSHSSMQRYRATRVQIMKYPSMMHNRLKCAAITIYFTTLISGTRIYNQWDAEN